MRADIEIGDKLPLSKDHESNRSLAVPVNNNKQHTRSTESYFGNIFGSFVTFLTQREPGIKLAVEDNTFYGDRVSHILTYDPAMLRTLIAPFLSYDLTVCYSFLIWFRYLGMCVYALLLMFILGRNAFPDTEFGETPACNSAKPTQNR